ncbi:DUF4199 domain-containing protein [Taibaiella koreensis]|uniref:DUF4199 domain-containing protein n=1 Tax=Taibaiella koreensis TaxID=1268548 RepID=UPI000E59E9D8|nr:DUF4199 domain-containing protein [Taibaiella koreensis]
MDQSSKSKTGLVFGLLTGIVYMLIIAARYLFFGHTTTEFTMSSVIGYLIIVVLFGAAGMYRRKQLGGVAELRDIFGTLFIVILITELCFTVFNYIYLWYIDPGFLDRFAQSTLNQMRGAHVPEAKLKEFELTMAAQKDTNFGAILFGFARSVVFDSLVGLIIAYALKRKDGTRAV